MNQTPTSRLFAFFAAIFIRSRFGLEQEDEPMNANEPSITVLANSAYYFFHHVLILEENKRFRLLVIHDNRILFDKQYKTPRGARISFEKSFNETKVTHEKAEWSPLFKPEPGWLELVLSDKYPEGVFRCG